MGSTMINVVDAITKLQKENLSISTSLLNSPDLPPSKQELDIESLSAILQTVLIPEIVVEIITGLNNEIINPNFLLSKSISNIRDNKNLIAIALALRYNANPNLYVSIPNIGIVHILVYVYIKLYEQVPEDLINMIILILIYSKSNPLLPAVDAEAGGVKSIFDAKQDISVITWLQNKKFPNTIELIQSNPDNIEQKILDEIGIYLDKPEMIKSPVDVSLIIMYHANKVLESKKSKIVNPEYVLSETVKYLNLEAFKKILSLNSMVSYFFVNDLLIRMKNYYTKNLILPFNITKTMLLMLIERGIKIDNYQLEIIKTTNEQNTKEILDAYQKPYWQKILNYTGPNISGNNFPDLSNKEVKSGKLSEVPYDLRILAYTLGLNYNENLQLIIEQIKQISFMEPENYKTAFIRRQMSRVSTNVSTPLDFVNEPKLEKYTARNIPLLRKDNKNPYEYNELDIGVYKDSNEVVWIFTSDMFDQVIDTKKNPYTGDDLPNEFINALCSQRSLVKRLGFNVGRSLTVNDGLEKLNKQDVVNNDENDRIVKQFEKLSSIYGVTESQLRNLTYQQKIDILNLHKIQINNLYEFSPEHQYIILSRGSLLYLQSISSDINFCDKIESFYDSIKKMVLVPT